jgi:hypothetical protein
MSWTRDKSSTWVTCFVHYGGGSSKDVVAKSGWVNLVIVFWREVYRRSRQASLYTCHRAIDNKCSYYIHHAVGSGWTGGVEHTGLAVVRGGGAGKVTVPVGLGNTNWLCVFHGAD